MASAGQHQGNSRLTNSNDKALQSVNSKMCRRTASFARPDGSTHAKRSFPAYSRMACSNSGEYASWSRPRLNRTIYLNMGQGASKRCCMITAECCKASTHAKRAIRVRYPLIWFNSVNSQNPPRQEPGQDGPDMPKPDSC